MIDHSRLTFLGNGLRKFQCLVVTVVGGGGGGAHVAQQLAHLGVGTLAIVEPDKAERSNINRLPCFNYSDIGKYKALVLARRLHGLGGTVIPVIARAESSEGRSWLERSDAVVGAVDGIRARSNIERICRGALVPYVDIGLGIDVADDGSIRSIGGQVSAFTTRFRWQAVLALRRSRNRRRHRGGSRRIRRRSAGPAGYLHERSAWLASGQQRPGAADGLRARFPRSHHRSVRRIATPNVAGC